jgi:outer membrane protein
MNNIKGYIAGFFSCLLIVTVAYIVVNYKSQGKIVYLDTQKVYDAYKQKGVLEKKLISYRDLQKAGMDSMYTEIISLEKQLASKKASEKEYAFYAEKRKDYEARLEKAQNTFTQLQSQYDKELWNDINTKVKEYCTEEGYSIVLGANGTGSLMHADPKLDITKEVIEYVNGM